MAVKQWQSELKNGIREVQDLTPFFGWDAKEQCERSHVADRYPMMITPYYLSLVDPDDPEDPIRRMCVPSTDELAPGGSFDTSGEESNTKQEGLQHKYQQTVLLLSTNQCAMYCRHCFRKRLVGLSDQELNKRVDEAAEYVRQHPEVHNVLVSGGDALLNSNQIIQRYLEELTAVEHVNYIRFGSRTPVVLPSRIYGDQELLDLLETYGKKKTLSVVTQFNHPRELTEEAAKAIRALLERGVQVRNQTVLLRGVNDDSKTLAQLLSGLTRLGVVPYYIFQCRPVTGVQGRFQVPIREGIRIVDGAKSMVDGFSKGVRYAMSHPEGKIEILCELENGEVLFKFHQSKRPENHARAFTWQLSESDTWLPEDI